MVVINDVKHLIDSIASKVKVFCGKGTVGCDETIEWVHPPITERFVLSFQVITILHGEFTSFNLW